MVTAETGKKGPLGAHWGPSGGLLGACWEPTGGPLGAHWGPTGGLLGAFWGTHRGPTGGPPGGRWGPTGGPLGAPWTGSPVPLQLLDTTLKACELQTLYVSITSGGSAVLGGVTGPLPNPGYSSRVA